MKVAGSHSILATLVALLLPSLESEALHGKDQAYTCNDGFMTVYISKEHFAHVPSSIYIQDDRGGYHQVAALAEQCNYLLRETETLLVLTVASDGCLVRRSKDKTRLNVVIMEQVGGARVKVVKTIPVTCERNIGGPLFSCSKDGFEITIPRNVTAPPLNLDDVRMTLAQGHCEPQIRSEDAVTFRFPFTDCGTQSTVSDGVLTYWASVETKRPQRGSIYRNPPLHLLVHCSFDLTKMTHLNIQVQGFESTPTVSQEGLLKTEMRFAKDATYKYFFSSRELPTVTELGQPVYVEVFAVKHQDKELTLLLEDCWATPTQNPNDPQRWNLLIKGCPFEGDDHRTVLLPVTASMEVTYPSLHKRFVVKLFSFVKPQTSEKLVYFHCDVNICKGPNCSQSCRRMQKLRGTAGELILDTVHSAPLLL